MQRCRKACLDELAAPGKALFLGEGPGRMLAELAQRFPDMQCTIVDSSAAMISQCRATAEGIPGLADRCEWIRMDVFSWLAGAGVMQSGYDLVVTCFFLDCLDSPALDRLISGISSRVSPGAVWLVADFSLPERGPARWRARTVVGLLYVFFRFTAGLQTRGLANPTPHFVACGWHREARRELDWGLLVCEKWKKHNHCPVQ